MKANHRLSGPKSSAQKLSNFLGPRLPALHVNMDPLPRSVLHTSADRKLIGQDRNQQKECELATMWPRKLCAEAEQLFWSAVALASREHGSTSTPGATAAFIGGQKTDRPGYELAK